MTDFFFALVIGGVIMGVLDALWLGIVAKRFYRSQIGVLLLDKPKMIPAVLFYVIYLVGVTVFVTLPAIQVDSCGFALAYGALFGLVAYATYDLTNLATIKGFRLKVVIVDMLWGAVLTALVATGTYLIVRGL